MDCDREAFETYLRQNALIIVRDECFVYVMQCHGHHKIGIAANVSARRERLQMASPLEVRLVKAFSMGDRHWARTVERACHEDLAGHRIHGEWFNADRDTVMESVSWHVTEARKLRRQKVRAVTARQKELWRRYLSDKAFRSEVNSLAYI